MLFFRKFKKLLLAFILTFIFLLNCLIVITFNSQKSVNFIGYSNNSYNPSKSNNGNILKFEKYGKKYCVLYNFWKSSSEYYSGNHITLVLHSTSEYLSYLIKQDSTWDGGISVALYIPSYNKSYIIPAISQTIHNLKNLQRNLTSEKISLHLFYKNATCHKKIKLNKNATTKTTTSKLPESKKLYPINVARNIGRKGMGTKLFISGDIEQIYVANFEPRMLKLANEVLLKNKTQTVLVHRRFEIADNATIPENKSELKNLYFYDLAVPFHERLYPKGHYIPGLSKWFNTNETKTNDELKIIKVIGYGNESWEPQYVADQRVPYHDERFPYRYRSNAHLANLLCMHGFTFSIVSDVFSVHRGILKKLPTAKREIFKHLKKLGVERLNKKFFRELKKMSPKKFKYCFRNSTLLRD